ncbi:serine/threonine-protein kinase RsbW [Sinomonas atrocyanea]|uniref:ATP-binding protein n=1 Tax=Sinomonas atrocyanea TaxID=37927 RepID=UPI002785EC9F|nr:ATP-binding protein [Sinomonas atrocyanea]MDP9886356.1 serine/threonine-protein kinase RsbW [Sinomonas atrocyanea]
MSGAAVVLRASGKRSEAFLTTVEGLLERLWHDDPWAGLADRTAFEIAVIEAVSNSIRHAIARAGTPMVLEIELRPTYRRLEAELREVGAQPTPSLRHEPGAAPAAGRGLAMLKQLMTEVRYERAGDVNVWTLGRDRTDI